jgi:hypothetical protein
MKFDWQNIKYVLKQITNEQDSNYVSYDKEFNEYECGKLVTKIVKQFSPRIEEMTNVQAMINFKFKTSTRSFFLIQ